MKNLYIALALMMSGTVLGQIGHSVNKPSGAVLNPINGIDSIRFNGAQTEMQIVLTNGTVVNHAIVDINNVTFTDLSSYPAGSVFCTWGATTIVYVTNPTTGRIWMDRNLGANQVAQNSTDIFSYGDLYQWGRRSDGHQCRSSPTTATLSSIDQPAHGNFILGSSFPPNDWRNPQNDNLWQGVNGVNNPCPSGYRIPTETELDTERLSWSQNNSSGALASPLKWTLAGLRNYNSGALSPAFSSPGFYWSSTVSGSSSRLLSLGEGIAYMTEFTRADGFSVRCIKD
jgi:uncharacterized protein (TIGR02145 family)